MATICSTASPVPVAITLRICRSIPKPNIALRSSTLCATPLQPVPFTCHVSRVSSASYPLTSLTLLSQRLPSVVAYMLAPMNRVMFTMYKFKWQTWRLSLLINMTPGILAIIFFATLPESAKFLLSIGEDERAYQTINRLYKSKRKQDLTSVGITGVTDPDTPSNLGDNRNCCVKIWRGTAPLFRQPLVGNFLICTTILCGFLFV